MQSILNLDFLDSFENEEEVRIFTNLGLYLVQRSEHKPTQNFLFLNKKYPIEESLRIDDLTELLIEKDESKRNKYISKFTKSEGFSELLISSKKEDEEKFMAAIFKKFKTHYEHPSTFINGYEEPENHIPKKIQQFKPEIDQKTLENILAKLFNDNTYTFFGGLCFKLEEGSNKEEYIHLNNRDYVSCDTCDIEQLKQIYQDKFLHLLKNKIKNLEKQYINKIKQKIQRRRVIKSLIMPNEEDEIKFKKTSANTYHLSLILAPYAIHKKNWYFIFDSCELVSVITFDSGKVKIKKPYCATENYINPFIIPRNSHYFKYDNICYADEETFNRWTDLGIDFNKFYEAKVNHKIQFKDSEDNKQSKTIPKLFADVIYESKKALQYGAAAEASDGGFRHLTLDNYPDTHFTSEREVLAKGIKKDNIHYN